MTAKVNVDCSKRQTRWYFGGLASAGAAACTHPLDLLKVHLQTQQKKDLGVIQMAIRVVKSDGLIGLYNGVTASLLRQLTYSSTRFGIYESVKNSVVNERTQKLKLQSEAAIADGQLSSPKQSKAVLSFGEMVALSAFAGLSGAIVGNPADMINVRMQNDMKLEPKLRRNYKHAIDGILRVVREEGARALMNGVSMTATRGMLVTVGQLAFYDQFKRMLIATGYFEDTKSTHITASIGAAGVAAVLTQPTDVLKTRLMNAARGGTNYGIMPCALELYRAAGPLGFYKGLVPAFVRLAPHTVLMFVFLEQLRMRFGVDPI